MGWQDDPLAYSVDANTQKFLDFIGKAEGADYNTIVGGGKFNSYAQHPNVVGLRTAEGPSTAAGKYQIVGTTYKDVAPSLGINDFSPESQDRIAVELIKRAEALDDVKGGNYQAAIKKLGNTWASLPSSPYSQPKRSQSWVEGALDMVVSPAQAAQSKGSWMNDPVVGEAAPQAAKGGWMNDPVVGEEPVSKVPRPGKVESAPLPDITPKKEEPKSWLRTIDDAVRGVADMATFGYADEIAAKMDTVFGGGQSGKTNYEEALKAQRQRDAEGGGARIAGQVGGALIPGAGVLNVVRAPANATRIGRAAAGAASGGATGALYGSGAAEGDLADRAQGAVTGGALGAATGGVLGGLLPATAGQVATKLEKKAGDPKSAAMDAEIIQDLANIAKNPNIRGNEVRAKLANALENRYYSQVDRLVKQLSDDDLARLGTSRDQIERVIGTVGERNIVSPKALETIRGNPVGDALADAVEKAQRTSSLTQQVTSSPVLSPVRGALGAITPEWFARGLNTMLGGKKDRVDVIQSYLKPKMLEAAQELQGRVGPSSQTISKQALEDTVLASQIGAGREAAATARQIATDKAQKETDKIAKLAAKAEEKRMIAEGAQILAEKKKAQAPVSGGRKAAEVDPNSAISELQGKDPTYLLGLSNPNGVPRNEAQMAEFSKVIRDQMLARQAREEASRLAQKGSEQVLDTRAGVLRATRTPLGGPFQELLQGGRSGLNLTTDEAVKGLRLLERKTDDPVLRDAIQRMRSSSGEVPGAVPDTNAFYGVQNALRRLQERGVLSGGQPQGALSAVNPVRNPIAYQANVDNAMGALKNASDNAPNKALAQFARKVAGTKSIADKEKMIADRLKKASPDEAAFLDQFVSPLTQFGKK